MQSTESPADLGREIQSTLGEIVATTELALQSQLTPPQQDHLHAIRRLAESAVRLLDNAQILPVANRTQSDSVADAPAIDWSAALQRARRNEVLLRETARRFVGECPRLLEQIQAGLADDDRTEVRRVANKLKSAAGIFAARATVEAANELEQIADAQAISDLHAAFRGLREQAEKAVSELQRFVETGAR
jgi:HPt (histidine-containing phosphotransfer) domain-containing protein